MFPEWTWLIGFYLGATIGSFLNVVIYRMPRAVSLSNPRHSFCPHCKHQLGVKDLFPLFSYLQSRGKCRYCGAKVTSRYFWVELFTGVIWAGIWWQYFIVAPADPAKGIFYALAAAALVAIIFIDWELYIIPDQVNAFLFIVGIGYNVYLYAVGSPEAVTWGMPSSVAGALVGVGALWGIAFLGRVLFRKDAMGHGDIKMARGIGALLFPTVAVMSFGLAVALGAVFGVIFMLLLSSKAGASESEEGGSGAAMSQEDEEPYYPESIGSLLKCGLGYLFLVDIVGLFAPKLYISYFGEDPFAPIEEDDDFIVERTMIPFGPYLAFGAIVATVFEAQLHGALDAYLRWSGLQAFLGTLWS